MLWLIASNLLQIPAAQAGSLAGRVLDASGAAVPGATVRLRLSASEPGRTARADAAGVYRFEAVAAGTYRVCADAPGFAESRETVELKSGEDRSIDLVLETATLAQEIWVNGNRIAGAAEALPEIPGSVGILDAATLAASRAFTADEALRKIPGVYVRGEEGFGLRPNIGIRGLNPTRSSKVLLLEDGIPLAYAPYGDNATYYHPPIDRFDGVEAVKGAGQILYGPSTVGGVINYLTPAIPAIPGGDLLLTAGNRNYLDGRVRYGGMWKNTGLLAEATRKQGDGSRENIRSGLSDFNVKSLTVLTPRQSLSFKGNYYAEDSNVTYSGLTEEEFRVNPRQNPFRNDFFYGKRIGASASYTNAFRPDFVLAANLYGSAFNRDWWRQSSNSRQRPNRLGAPGCAGMADLLSRCGNEGRLRGYHTWGVEPRFRSRHRAFRMWNEADFGIRAHFEDQDRQQKNGPLPWSRDGQLVEDNKRETQAYSAFLQNRFVRGRFGLTPGLRLEHVRYSRTNRLTGASGTAQLTQVIPGIGASFSHRGAVFFAGLHRGFAPPRTEDIITNAGGATDLDAELSWNYELGVRARIERRVSVEATAFRMDYANQIVPASVAGGIGATMTSAGRTLHEGVEFACLWDLASPFGSRHGVLLRTAYTYLPVARFEGARYSSVPGFSRVPVTGNRLPYAPAHLFNSSAGYTHPGGLNVLVEAVGTSRQAGDDLGTVAPTPDGQRGTLPGNVLWNAAVNYPMEAARATLFISIKNLSDRVVIVDRTRGILPGQPRLIQFGLRWRF